MSRRSVRLSARVAAILAAGLLAGPLLAYLIPYQWDDFAPIVMDDIFYPASLQPYAEGELARWNDLRNLNGNHPFQLNVSPDVDFDFNDGDNTMGFLDGATLFEEYGLRYVPAIAWTVRVIDPSTLEVFEADIMFDTAPMWSLSEDAEYPFRSTMLHESGHAQGLQHYETRLAIMYPYANSALQNTIYSDDAAGIDSRYTLLDEVDVAALAVWHDGTEPKWMTRGPGVLREGQAVTFTNFTAENKGSRTATNPTFQIVLSASPSMSAPLTVMDTWTETQIAPHDYASYTRTATVPQVDCGVYYPGLFIPSPGSWNERHQENNIVAFRNGSSTPAPLSISLAYDALEPNDTFGTPFPLPAANLPNAPYDVDLTIDQDGEVDHFWFSLPALRWVDLTVLYDAAHGDVDMALYNLAGNAIDSATTGFGVNHIRQRLGAGTYVVKVYGNGAGSCNHYRFVYYTAECLQDYECDGSSAPACRSSVCSNFTCQNVVPRPCDDGDACTLDICVQDHGGYCLFAPNPAFDPDGDGVCAQLDCSPQDPQAWSPPAEASMLTVAADVRTIGWEALDRQAGPGVLYDLLRGTLGTTTTTAGAADLCRPGLADSVAVDDAIPPPGQAFWYVVRGHNACGAGSFGTSSAGAERMVSPCE